MSGTTDVGVKTEEGIVMSAPETQNHPMPAHRRKSPLAAGLLSLMPGLGQIYVGYYRRGFVHIAIFAGLITLLGDRSLVEIHPFLGISVAFIYLYSIIDAVRLAGLYNDAVAGFGPEDLRRELVLRGRTGSIGSGIALLAVGVLFLLNTLFGVSMSWLREWWPVLPIGFGLYLLVRGIQDRRRPTRDEGIQD